MLHAYGCDSVMEDSCILIQGRSVEEVPEGVEVPEFKGWRNGRMDVKAFKAKIEILSPTSARTSIVANIDPKAPVPQAVVNFVVREVDEKPFPAPCRHLIKIPCSKVADTLLCVSPLLWYVGA